MEDIGELIADAVDERDFLKDKLALKYSELDKAIRDDPGEFGFDAKPTEPAIKSAIQNDPSYVDIQNQLRKATHSVNVLQNAKESIKEKGKRLGDIVSLWLGNYYSDVKLPSEASEKNSSEFRRAARRRQKLEDRRKEAKEKE
jgi:hypothetical protein